MKLHLSEYDAVAWDFDGTLTDAYHVHEAARYEVFGKNGFGHITPAEHALGHTYGTTTHDIIAGVLKAAGELPVDTDPYSSPLVQKLVTEKRALYKEAAGQGLDAQPGAVELVRLLGNHFVGKMIIVTTAQRDEVLPFINRYNLEQYFDSEAIICEETMFGLGQKLKPAPDAYVLAVQRLTPNNPASLLTIEDSKGGVESAILAGTTCLAVGTTHTQTEFFDEDTLYQPKLFAATFADIELVA